MPKRRKKIAEEHERRKRCADVAPCRTRSVKVITPQSVPVIQVRYVDDSADGANAAVSDEGASAARDAY